MMKESFVMGIIALLACGGGGACGSFQSGAFQSFASPAMDLREEGAFRACKIQKYRAWTCHLGLKNVLKAKLLMH